MKNRIDCAYKDICNSSNKCTNCQLRNAPYDKTIAVQIKRDNKNKQIEEQNRYDLAQEILNRR
jgi:hypothetical protein